MATKVTTKVINEMSKVLQEKFIPELYKAIKKAKGYNNCLGIPDIEDYIIHWEHVFYDGKFDSVGIGRRSKKFNERIEINAHFYLEENKIGYNYKLKIEGLTKEISTTFIYLEA
jgi:hypothetical protein